MGKSAGGFEPDTALMAAQAGGGSASPLRACASVRTFAQCRRCSAATEFSGCREAPRRSDGRVIFDGGAPRLRSSCRLPANPQNIGSPPTRKQP